jgi:hypothetical protein
VVIGAASATSIRLPGGHAHALAVHRVEAANGVAKRKQAARKRFVPMTPWPISEDAPKPAIDRRAAASD